MLFTTYTDARSTRNVCIIRHQWPQTMSVSHFIAAHSNSEKVVTSEVL